MLVGWGGAAIGMTLLRRPPAAGPLVGIALMVFCAGLAVAGPGIWMKFALEPWRRSAADGNGSKILVLVFRTWACGWFGFLGLARFAFRALLSVGVIVR